MKKLLIGLLFFLPSMAFASGIVQIDTTIHNVNGGTLDFSGLNLTQLVTPGGAYSKPGTPQFFIPAGSYQVIFTPPQGYSETHSANCTGSVEDSQTVHCQVTYTDGTPEQATTTVPVITFGSSQVTSNTPVVQVAHSGLTAGQVSALIGVLRA